MAEEQDNSTQPSEGQSGSAGTETQTEIHACEDAMLPLALQEEALQKAIEENPANGVEKIDPATGERAFVVTGKLWSPSRRTLRVKFLGGTPAVQEKVKQYANKWSEHIGIKFDFGDHAESEIRVAFVKGGSRSFVGTDALSIPQDTPTMNFGWFDKPQSEDEYSRVIIHEFGHALGMPHEHNNPAQNIPWNKEVVYRYYEGPPNNWSREKVDTNLFSRYEKTLTQFTEFDKQSIMLYPIPKEFVTDPSYVVGMNTKLSETDKQFMSKIYPKS
jgi:hypothetical protein